MKTVIAVVLAYTLYSFIVLKCYSRPSGAPSQVCGTMMPGHKVKPQNGMSPFVIHAKHFDIDNEYLFKVVLTSQNLTKFKGFLLQARRKDEKPFGIWETNNKYTKTIKCSDDNVIYYFFIKLTIYKHK